MRRPIVAGNWKMNTTRSEAEELVLAIRTLASAAPTEVVICPPYVWLDLVRRTLEGSNMKTGAQDVYWEESGAYTGQIAVTQLVGMCEYVIVGHSERRRLFGDTDEIVARKVAACVGTGLIPILAVGEDAEEHAADRAAEVVRRQVATALAGIAPQPLVAAYEPVWAIGTGDAANPVHAQWIATVIRDELRDAGYEPETVPVLYGGSVNPDNFPGFLAQPDIDGGLVGGASLDARTFATLVEQASTAAY
jgi:triosephosphate isomerase